MDAPPGGTEAQLKTLMRLVFVIDAATEGMLGKGAPAMMYQSGRDAAGARAARFTDTEDVDRALEDALAEGGGAWHFERWMDPGQEEYWMRDGAKLSGWLVFTACPLMSLARSVGSGAGGLLCQAMHGYLAGCLASSMGRRVDMKIAHCGPRACKVLLEMRG